MAWKGYTTALASDPGGVKAVLATRVAATPERAAMSPSVADELAHIIENESGWDPAATNWNQAKTDGATGLIQFLPSTAKGLGTTTAALRKMSRRQQAPYVQKFFDQVTHSGKRTVKRVGDLYILTFMPGFLDAPDEQVIAEPDSQVWRDNPGLREGPEGPDSLPNGTIVTRNVGPITAGSVRARGTPSTPRPSSGKGTAPSSGRSGSGLGLVLLIALVVYAMKKGGH